jgi:ribosomal-protein-alanine N-acetyltransferase
VFAAGAAKPVTRHTWGVEQALSLRQPRREDWPRVHEWGSNSEVCRYQVWGPNSPSQSEEFVAAAVATWQLPEDQRSRWVWLAEHPYEGVVGAGELHIRSRQHRQGEISYIVHPDYWRLGYATDIGQQLLETGFRAHGLQRIYATCDPRNVASAAVLQKLGMRREGRLRHTHLLRDGWRDSELFAVVDERQQNKARRLTRQ